ncbi:DUF2188 domain-containing protein [Halomonas sp.]|uniref:DUF2188 domain-containing protein n=1 Tax=Halomonas sp. TaxID=1486246 RepID=UPI00298E8CE2|nr:DUF2188 domain-containing protein [Halomonas sp.]MDW7747574.1 DUF2188 domain-containing protein [Halomonas sp.]
MNRSTHHVVPNAKGGWSVHRGSSGRATRHFATKKAAEAYGRKVSFNQKTTLVIHREDGTAPPSGKQG